MRFFNTYGPLQSEDFVVSKFIKQAMNGESITINGDGLQTRTFCYIDDNIEATSRCMYEDLYVNDVINVGNDNEVSVLELAKLILDVTGYDVDVVHQSALKEGDMARRKPDITKMRAIMQKDLVSLKEGIEKVYENFLNN